MSADLRKNLVKSDSIGEFLGSLRIFAIRSFPSDRAAFLGPLSENP
jgi:hypothetical protein